MEYRIRKVCEQCGLEHYQIVRHACKLRKTCSEECHRKLAGRNCHKQPRPDPTPDEISEMCWKIRTGRLKIVGTQVTEDCENKNRRNRANTFVRVNHGA